MEKDVEKDKDISNEEIAKIIGERYAHTLFTMFSDPDMRGPNFTWKRFPVIAATQARAGTFTCFKNGVEDLDKLEEISYNSCLKEAKELSKDNI
jgi:hypothetical protein